MSGQRGRACQCCASAKRRCTGERPCKRCISLAPSLEQAVLMCVELPDKRTKHFVAQRKKSTISGVKRAVRGRPELQSDYSDYPSVTKPQTHPEGRSHNIFHEDVSFGRDIAGDGLCAPPAAKRRVAAANHSTSDFDAPMPFVAAAQSSLHSDILVAAQKRLASAPLAPFITKEFAQSEHFSARLGSRAFAHTQDTTPATSSYPPELNVNTFSSDMASVFPLSPVSLAENSLDDSFCDTPRDIAPPASADEVVERCIRSTLENSFVPTFQIVFNPAAHNVKSCYANSAWTKLFGVTSEQLDAMAMRDEIPRYVHPEDVSRYSSTSLRTLRTRASHQVLTARFVGSGGRIFCAQEASQLEYNSDGAVKRITMYYTEQEAGKVVPAASAVARSANGGITLPQHFLLHGGIQPPMKKPTLVPLDAGLHASIHNTLRLIQEGKAASAPVEHVPSAPLKSAITHTIDFAEADEAAQHKLALAQKLLPAAVEMMDPVWGRPSGLFSLKSASSDAPSDGFPDLSFGGLGDPFSAWMMQG